MVTRLEPDSHGHSQVLYRRHWRRFTPGRTLRSLWHGIQNLRNDTVVPWFDNLRHRVAAFFSQATQWLLTAGGDLIEGFLHGILAKMEGIAGWVKSHIVDPIVNAVKHFFGIHSPSTVFRDLASMLIVGFIEGIINGAGSLTGMVTKILRLCAQGARASC